MRSSPPGPERQPTLTGKRRVIAGTPRAPDLRLKVVYPPGVEGDELVTRGSAVIGRVPEESTLVVERETVSRRHAGLEWDPFAERYFARDMGSRNGTFLNGVQLSQSQPIGDNDVLRFGDVLVVCELGRQPDRDADSESADALPGCSRRIREARLAVQRAARDPGPVLLLGETGTGKEMLAREIHRLSGRRGPFVAVNCAAMSPQLVESELFGHTAGAFTGATASHPGLFRRADGGTLLLDEIGEMPLDLQPKLLRALQELEVMPVGSMRPIPVNVRVLAATHRDLMSGRETGVFRRDLYARLSLWEVRLPALRDRRVDLLDWLAILERCWRQERGEAPTRLRFGVEAAERLLLHPWPENLRGLDRCLRMVSSIVEEPHAESLEVADLPQEIRGGADEPRSIAHVDRHTTPTARLPAPDEEELRAALLAHRGSVRAIAKQYGRDRRQVYRWLDRFGLRGFAREG